MSGFGVYYILFMNKIHELCNGTGKDGENDES